MKASGRERSAPRAAGSLLRSGNFTPVSRDASGIGAGWPFRGREKEISSLNSGLGCERGCCCLQLYRDGEGGPGARDRAIERVALERLAAGRADEPREFLPRH